MTQFEFEILSLSNLLPHQKIFLEQKLGPKVLSKKESDTKIFVFSDHTIYQVDTFYTLADIVAFEPHPNLKTHLTEIHRFFIQTIIENHKPYSLMNLLEFKLRVYVPEKLDLSKLGFSEMKSECTETLIHRYSLCDDTLFKYQFTCYGKTFRFVNSLFVEQTIPDPLPFTTSLFSSPSASASSSIQSITGSGHVSEIKVSVIFPQFPASSISLPTITIQPHTSSSFSSFSSSASLSTTMAPISTSIAKTEEKSGGYQFPSAPLVNTPPLPSSSSSVSSSSVSSSASTFTSSTNSFTISQPSQPSWNVPPATQYSWSNPTLSSPWGVQPTTSSLGTLSTMK